MLDGTAVQWTEEVTDPGRQVAEPIGRRHPAIHKEITAASFTDSA